MAMQAQMWEYRVVRGEVSEAGLNDLGDAGWELVSVGEQGGQPTAYLKRPRLGFKERVTLEQREKYARMRGDTLAAEMEARS